MYEMTVVGVVILIDITVQLENELHACKERMYITVEEKNRLDEQLGQMQSTVFTSEHQLHSVQVPTDAQLLPVWHYCSSGD